MFQLVFVNTCYKSTDYCLVGTKNKVKHYITLIVISFFSPSWLEQKTAKGPCGLRVNLVVFEQV